MSLWHRIVTLGIRNDMRDDLKSKIALSNILALTLCFIIIFYALVALFLIPDILAYCLYGLLAYSLVFVLNGLGAEILARFTMAIAPSLVVGMLQGVAMQNGDSVFIEIYAFEIVAALIPFALFHVNRIQFWLPAVIINMLVLFNINWFNSFFSKEFDNSAFQDQFIQAVILIGSLALGGFIIIFLQKTNERMTENAKKLSDNLAEENKKAADKESELTESLKKLEEAQKEEKKRNWATTGIAEISSLLRAEDDLKILTDKIISFIVKYLNANQGGLFLLNNEDEDDQFLELKACYAFDRKKFVEKRVEFGQGLVGQAYLEKDYIYLTDIPQNYVHITSGLGTANPTALLIVPMIVNEEVYGIFEIASFHKFEQHEIDFMMELGENIAMTLNSFKINEKTKKLLEETQEQSLQMASQEEEMRQNMEELEATQEQQKRLEEELRIQLEEANKAKEEVEIREKQIQESSEKNKKKALKFREKLEEMDILVEGKNAELLKIKRILKEDLVKYSVSRTDEDFAKLLEKADEIIKTKIDK